MEPRVSRAWSVRAGGGQDGPQDRDGGKRIGRGELKSTLAFIHGRWSAKPLNFDRITTAETVEWP